MLFETWGTRDRGTAVISVAGLPAYFSHELLTIWTSVMVTKIWLIDPCGPEQVAGSLTITLTVPMVDVGIVFELPQLARRKAMDRAATTTTREHSKRVRMKHLGGDERCLLRVDQTQLRARFMP